MLSASVFCDSSFLACCSLMWYRLLAPSDSSQYFSAMISMVCWLIKQPSGPFVLPEHVGCCGTFMKLCCIILQLRYHFCPSLLFSLLVIVVDVVVAATAAAESLASDCFSIADLGGSPILDCICWRKGCSAFDSYSYNLLDQFAWRQNYQIDNYCFHSPSTKITRWVGLD